jgi:hypothetical protein
MGRLSLDENRVNEILEEAFTSDELLDHQSLAEKKAFTANYNAWVLTGNPRNTVISFLRNFTRWIQQEETWTLATVLVDSYCCRKGRSNPDEQEQLSPDVAAACAILAAKQNNQACVYKRSADIAQLVAFLAQCHPEAVTTERIKQAELHVLQVLDWRVNLTAVQEWCISFLRRLAAHTGREDIAYRATKVLSYWSEYFTSQVPATEGIPPKVLATGAFALTLMYTGLLSHNACKPRDVGQGTWNNMPIIENARQASARIEEDTTTNKLQEPCSIAQVAKAVGCSVQKLKEDVYGAIEAFNQTTTQNAGFRAAIM